MYGGQINGDVTKTFNNGIVHVLSLPSFNWQKQAAPPEVGRCMHTCNVVGNRQMLSVGGVCFFADTTSDAFLTIGGVVDPWDQGFGIFDMTEMEWKSSYDASAGPYTTPDSVKAFIKKNGRYPYKWTDSGVEDWFTNPGMSRPSVNPAMYC